MCENELVNPVGTGIDVCLPGWKKGRRFRILSVHPSLLRFSLYGQLFNPQLSALIHLLSYPFGSINIRMYAQSNKFATCSVHRFAGSSGRPVLQNELPLGNIHTLHNLLLVKGLEILIQRNAAENSAYRN